MSTLLLRATSLLTALGLAGTPAVLAACLALCAPGMAHAATDIGRDVHAGHASTVEVAHEGHQTPDPHAAHHGEMSDAAGTAASCCPDARWQGVDASCCPDAAVTFGTKVPAARDGAGLLYPVAVTVARVFAPPSSPASFSPLSRPLVPPSPTRSPLVLRI